MLQITVIIDVQQHILSMLTCRHYVDQYAADSAKNKWKSLAFPSGIEFHAVPRYGEWRDFYGIYEYKVHVFVAGELHGS